VDIIDRVNGVTRFLNAARHGDPNATAQLLPLVYDELRRLAAAKMATERPDHSLNATALVQEEYLRLVGSRAYADHRHFFRVAAEAMRQILIDRARHHRRARHGGDRRRVPLAEAEFPLSLLKQRSPIATVPFSASGLDDLVVRSERISNERRLDSSPNSIRTTR
jgi:RNA polymerase sigma factor (TIGR02999 family)